MADSRECYSLRPVRSAQEWKAYHAIRREAIFDLLLPGQAYDEHDEDEFKTAHLPHLLFRDDKAVGTVRIDLIDAKQAGLRLSSPSILTSPLHDRVRDVNRAGRPPIDEHDVFRRRSAKISSEMAME